VPFYTDSELRGPASTVASLFRHRQRCQGRLTSRGIPAIGKGDRSLLGESSLIDTVALIHRPEGRQSDSK